MNPFAAELLGTMLLIIFGGGVCANVSLAKTGGNNAGWMVIASGWGLGVAMAVYAVSGISGAHINPAVTLGLASIGKMEWTDVPLYITAQMLGAIIGATVVWLAYLPHWVETPDASVKRGVFCTAPAIQQPAANLLCEIIGTFVLVLGVLAIFSPDTLNPELKKNLTEVGGATVMQEWEFGLKPLLVGLLVVAIGLSLGGPTGYAINPAKDLGPRIAHALLPIAGKGDSDWKYAWIPVAGPVIGGMLGALTYQWLW